MDLVSTSWVVKPRIVALILSTKPTADPRNNMARIELLPQWNMDGHLINVLASGSSRALDG
jgi:hypothetical protein